MLSNNDEEIIQKLYNWLVINFPLLRFKMKVPLKKLFPKPRNQWLQSFWGNNSHADIAVFRHSQIIAIIEPGGFYHASDEKQRRRDLQKDLICRENKVHCLRFFNNVVENNLGMLKTKRLFKKHFYGKF